MPTRGQVQKQLEKEPTVVHPVFMGSRKASQGCASWSAVQNITCGEPHWPSPHPLAAGTRLLHCAFRLCFACKPAGQGWPSQTESVLHYPSANHPVCEQWAQRHLSWLCAGQVTGCIGLKSAGQVQLCCFWSQLGPIHRQHHPHVFVSCPAQTELLWQLAGGGKPSGVLQQHYPALLQWVSQLLLSQRTEGQL